MWLSRRFDPGPCPVDDAPHTTCVAPAPVTTLLQPSQQVTVAVQRPGWMREAPPPDRTVTAPFTTATYKRSLHGRKRR